MNKAEKTKVRTKIVTRTIVRTKADRKKIRKVAARALTVPKRCKKTRRLMFMVGDTPEVMKRKADNAVGKLNATIISCAEYFERNRRQFDRDLRKGKLS